MRVSLCSLYEPVTRAVFSMVVCHIFPQCVLVIIPLIGIPIGVVVTRDCSGGWVGPPLCSVVVTALWGAESAPVVGGEAPRPISELQCNAGWTGILLLGEERLSTPSQELSTWRCSLWHHLLPVLWAHKYTVVGITLIPASTWQHNQSPWTSLRSCAHNATGAYPPVHIC